MGLGKPGVPQHQVTVGRRSDQIGRILDLANSIASPPAKDLKLHAGHSTADVWPGEVVRVVAKITGGHAKILVQILTAGGSTRSGNNRFGAGAAAGVPD